MYIKHHPVKNIYFSESYKDNKDNLIFLSWKDITKIDESFPSYFYKEENQLEKSYQPINVFNNTLIQDLALEDLLELEEFTQTKQQYTINGIIFPLTLDIECVYYKNDKSISFYYKKNEIFYKLNNKLQLTDKVEKLTSFEKVLDNSSLFKKLDEIKLINGVNLEDIDFKSEEDENGNVDMFQIDYLNNLYLNSNGKYKLIKNGKLKPIKLVDIESILLYKDNEENYILTKFEFETNEIDKVKKLTLEDLEKILWNVADLIRDKSSLDDVMDYMRVSIPLLVVKKLLDNREYVIKTEIINEDNMTYVSNRNDYPNNYLIQTFKDTQNIHNDYSVKDEIIENYAITWEDIVSFEETLQDGERTIKLKSFDVEIKTKAKTKQQFLEEIIEGFKNPKIQRIFTVTEFLSKIKDTKKVPNEVFLDILKLFNEYSFNEKNASDDIFSQSYMYLISTFAEGAGKKGGEFFTPTALIQKLLPSLNITLPNTKGEILIADPTSGSCSFVMELADLIKDKLVEENPEKEKQEIQDLVNRKLKIVTQEKGETSEIMGDVNLMFKKYENHISFQGNTINEYNKYIGQYRNKLNYIVANPPYGLKDYGYNWVLNNDSSSTRWQYGIPKKGDGDIAFLLSIIDLLSPEGKSGTLLPLGTLFKDSTKEIRKKLIQEDLIEGLMVLPSSMFQTTQIPVVWWIINKDKKPEDKGKIFMVNASNEFIKKGKFNEWQEAKSINNYLNRIIEEGISGYVTIEDIEENDWNLSVQRYIFKDEPEEKINIIELSNDIKELRNKINTQENEMNFVFDMVLSLDDK